MEQQQKKDEHEAALLCCDHDLLIKTAPTSDDLHLLPPSSSHVCGRLLGLKRAKRLRLCTQVILSSRLPPIGARLTKRGWD